MRIIHAWAVMFAKYWLHQLLRIQARAERRSKNLLR